MQLMRERELKEACDKLGFDDCVLFLLGTADIAELRRRVWLAASTVNILVDLTARRMEELDSR